MTANSRLVTDPFIRMHDGRSDTTKPHTITNFSKPRSVLSVSLRGIVSVAIQPQ